MIGFLKILRRGVFGNQLEERLRVLEGSYGRKIFLQRYRIDAFFFSEKTGLFQIGPEGFLRLERFDFR